MSIRANPKTSATGALCATLTAWLVASSTAIAQPARVSAPDATGEWLVAKQVARIKIADCDGRLWGVVAWEVQPGTDSKNPDRTLRSRPTLGMPILLGMTPKKPNQWDGQIYNSQDGNTYSASITLLDPNTLRVQGCFLGFLCGGENWTRFEPQDAPNIPPTQSSTIKPPSNGQAAAPTQSTTARPPSNAPANATTQNTTPKPPNPRKAAGNQPEPSDDVCSRALGTTGLSHERGLK